MSIPSLFVPQKNVVKNFTYKNIRQLYLDFYKIGISDTILVHADTLHLSDTLTFSDRVGKWQLPKLGYGKYLLKVSPDGKKFKESPFSISDMFAISENLPNTPGVVVVLDSRTGKPLSGINVKLFSSNEENSYMGMMTTNNKGIIVVPDTVCYFKPESKNDRFYPVQKIERSKVSGNKESIFVSLFTDRSVYRLGQTVQFSGVGYLSEEMNHRVVPDTVYTIILSSNSDEIARKEVRSDSFGSFSGSFKLPEDGKNDYFSIYAEGSSYREGIHISKYKEPKFNILFEPVKNMVVLGQAVSVTGKIVDLSGLAMSGTEVSYTIRRSRYERSIDIGRQIEEGKLVIGDNGDFTIRFVPEKDAEDNLKTGVIYIFKIDIGIVTVNDEIQTQSYSIVVTESSLFVQMDVPDQIDKNQPNPIRFVISDTMKKPEKVFCKYILYSLCGLGLHSDENSVSPASLKILSQVEEKSFRSDSIPALGSWKRFPSGRYRIALQVTDSDGKLIIRETDFVLYGMGDKKPPVNIYEWIPKTDYEVVPGEKVDIIFGTSLCNAHVLFNLYDSNRLVESRWVKLSEENCRFKVLYKSEYSDRLMASFLFVHNGKIYYSQVNIKHKRPDQKLNITTSTFRDKTLPNTAETWSFTVKDSSGNPVSAHFVAGMFESSLNQVVPNEWHFIPFHYPRRYSIDRNWPFSNWIRMIEDIAYPTCSPLSFDHFGICRFIINGKTINIIDSQFTVKSELGSEVNWGALADITKRMEWGNKNDTSIPLQYQQSFDKTAFFYSQLTTDQQGEVTVRFTVPKKNAEWQFQALAYTKDMKFGLYQNTMVAQKMVVATLNTPPFLCRGKNFPVSVLIRNISPRLLSGDYILELFDPDSDKVLVQRKQKFIIEKGAHKSEEVRFTVSTEKDMLGIRVRAIALGANDGEQYILPVRPSCE